jgi:hypothetical protein
MNLKVLMMAIAFTWALCWSGAYSDECPTYEDCESNHDGYTKCVRLHFLKPLIFNHIFFLFQINFLANRQFKNGKIFWIFDGKT